MFEVFFCFTKHLTLLVILVVFTFIYQPLVLAQINASLITSDKNSRNESIHLKVDLSDHQVTIYQGSIEGKSYSIGVGKYGWETPTGNFVINQKILNPAWQNPITEDIISGGDPENPLGGYWIGFSNQGWIWYGFHETNQPESVGKAVSHGCLRMYKQDIQELFSQVKLGTPINIIQ